MVDNIHIYLLNKIKTHFAPLFYYDNFLFSFNALFTSSEIVSKLLKKKHDPAKPSDDEAKWDRVPTKIEMNEVLSTDLQVNSPYTPDKSERGAK